MLGGEGEGRGIKLYERTGFQDMISFFKLVIYQIYLIFTPQVYVPFEDSATAIVKYWCLYPRSLASSWNIFYGRTLSTNTNQCRFIGSVTRCLRTDGIKRRRSVMIRRFITSRMSTRTPGRCKRTDGWKNWQFTFDFATITPRRRVSS